MDENQYYLLDDGRVYDRIKCSFVDEQDPAYKEFVDNGYQLLKIGNGYSVESLKRSVLKFYGYPIGECLLTLDELKQKRLDALNEKAEKFESSVDKSLYFESSLGFKCNGDRRTKDNLESLIQYFDLQAKDGVLSYRDYENVNQNLTKENLETLLQELVQYQFDFYQKKWGLEEQIKNAGSAEELNLEI